MVHLHRRPQVLRDAPGMTMVALEALGDDAQTPQEEAKALHAQTPLVGHTPRAASPTHTGARSRDTKHEKRGDCKTRESTRTVKGSDRRDAGEREPSRSVRQCPWERLGGTCPH